MSECLKFNTGFIYYFRSEEISYFGNNITFNEDIFTWSHDDFNYLSMSLNTIKLHRLKRKMRQTIVINRIFYNYAL